MTTATDNGRSDVEFDLIRALIDNPAAIDNLERNYGIDPRSFVVLHGAYDALSQTYGDYGGRPTRAGVIEGLKSHIDDDLFEIIVSGLHQTPRTIEDVDRLVAQLRRYIREEESFATVTDDDGYEWPEPIDFETGTLPAFPVDALPPVLAAWAAACRDAIQVPIDLPACLSLSVLAASAAKKFRVCPWGQWVEPLNLYSAVVLDPANRKSEAFKLATKPFLEYESDSLERVAPQVKQEQTDYDIARRRYEKLMKTAGEAASDSKRQQAHEEARAMADTLAEWVRPELPVLCTSDVTSERLAVLMSQNQERMACFSAEGGIFSIMAGKYSSGSDFELYLKGHAGDSVSVDRQSRQRVNLKEPAITMGLTIQPAVLEQLTANKEFRRKGLLARFLYAVPQSQIGSRNVRTGTIEPAVQSDYDRVVRGLCELPISDGVLRLTDDAAGVLHSFCASTETSLGSGRLAELTDWGGKLNGLVVRLAGLFQLAEGTPVAIEADAVRSAVTVGQWAIDHAEAALGYHSGYTSEVVSDARYLHGWICRERIERFTKRQARRYGKARFEGQSARLDIALSELVERGWVRRDGAHRTGGTEVYDVHPNTRF